MNFYKYWKFICIAWIIAMPMFMYFDLPEWFGWIIGMVSGIFAWRYARMNGSDRS